MSHPGLGFALGGCCAQGWPRGRPALAGTGHDTNLRLGVAFGGGCAPGWPRGLAKRLGQEATQEVWPRGLAKRLGQDAGQEDG